MSCGTGAVASAYVAHRLGNASDRAIVHTTGESLRIFFEAGGEAFMAGTAVRVYEGTVEM